MLSVSTSASALDHAHLDALLREVVETLAAIDRTPCSPGERQAAEWLASRLSEVGRLSVSLEEEPSWGTFPPNATGLGLLGVAGAVLVLAGRRVAGALVAAASFAGVVDEAQNGPRVLRRLVRRQRTTVNLVARAGWRPREGAAPANGGGAPETGTLVVLAHHDAPQTGVLFDQTLQRRLYELAPQLIERAHTAPPQWWLGLAGPLCTVAASLGARRRLAIAGLAIGG